MKEGLLSKYIDLGIRFTVDNDKLKILFPKGGIDKELLNEIKENKDFILASLNGVSNEKNRTPVLNTEKKEYYELSPAQKGIYVIQNLFKSSTAYNMPFVKKLNGFVGKNEIEDIFKELIQRHDILRSSYYNLNNRTVFKISDNVDFKLEQIETENNDLDQVFRDFIRPFNLSKPPLLRIGYLYNRNDITYLFIDLHHIISDGISNLILGSEFELLLNKRTLIKNNYQFHDINEWRNLSIQIEKRNDQLKFWKNELENNTPVLNLKTDFPRQTTKSFNGASYTFNIDKEVLDSIRKSCKRNKMTLFMKVYSVFSLLFLKLSNQDEIIIGTPIAGRSIAEMNTVVGMFVNSLPIYSKIDSDQTVIEFLGNVKEKILACFSNQNVYLDEIVESINYKSDPGRNPLFDIMIHLQNHADSFNPQMDKNQNEDEDEDEDFRFISTSKFDILLNVAEKDDKLNFSFHYNTDLFKEETIKGFSRYYVNILNQVLNHDSLKISDVEILSQEEKKDILNRLNKPYASYPNNKTIIECFEEQVQKTPDHISCILKDEQITYRELDEGVKRLACKLIESGVKPKSIVALLCDRSKESIVGILAIIKAGGIYLPIETDFPKQRILFMLENSDAKFVLTDKSNLDLPIKDINIIDLKNQDFHSSHLQYLGEKVSSNEPLYVIYTSGSTGKPKGVLVENRNLVSLFFNSVFPFDFTNKDIWSMFHSYCFDFSVWEMYGALLFGGKLILVPKESAKDTKLFHKLVIKEGVTVLNQTPSAFSNFTSIENSFKATELYIRYVIFGGEALNVIKLKGWKDRYPMTQFVNMYGITETTIHSTIKRINEEDILLGISNIGKPLPNLNILLLDHNMNIVPPGIEGEIFISGDGVSQGYLKNQPLTDERFVFLNYNNEERYYRSGDRARWLPNGDLEYLGRIDQQVKIRGYRIELAEIESIILALEEVEEVVVVDQKDKNGDNFLSAYIVYNSEKEEMESHELKSRIGSDLPDYMIPSFFISLQNIPITVNGKVDRKNLPILRPEGKMNIVKPRDIIEQDIVKIWSEVLGIEKDGIGIFDSFFNIGGDSIKITQLSVRLSEYLDKEIDITLLFERTTVASIVEFIRNDAQDENEINETTDQSSSEQVDEILNIIDADN